MIKDKFSACYEMVRELAYEGVKKEWPPSVEHRREIKTGIKNCRAHDLLCEVDSSLHRLVKDLENFLEKAGYEMPRHEIPEQFRKIVEEGKEK